MTSRLRVWVCVALLVLVPVLSFGASAAPAPIFRVFLKDGTALACWGEYARVGDGLVLTVPIGQGTRATYEFVSVPLAKVDLIKTERYAEAVRAALFAAARGAREYTELSDRLSEQLSSISSLPDARQTLTIAENARQQLIDWAGTSHGYKANDVQQLLSMFDSAIIDLRVAAGESRFSINLSARTLPPAPPRLRAAPSLRESIDLALKASMVADSGATRVALLKRARSAVSRLDKENPDVQKLRATIIWRLARELRIEDSYRRLMWDVQRQSARAVVAGDVVAIDTLRQRVMTVDRSLGHRRADDIAALLIDLEAAQSAAAEHRLVLDEWESSHADLVEYHKAVAGLLKELDALAPTLTAIKQMSGPPVTRLVTAEKETAGMVATFSRITAPEGADAVHALVGKAIETADLACRTRHRAIFTRKLPVAREAAAAAVDARAAIVRAREALAAALRPPKASR